MLEQLDVEAVEPYEGGRPFGAAGPYEWVRAVARYAVDPSLPGNDRICDLHLAPRDDDGLVRYDGDVRLLRPTGDGNRRLLFVVPNRGFLGGVPFSADAPLQWGPTEELHPGDGLLLEQGWTIAWGGWQWDVVRGPGVVGLTAPEAAVEPGWMRMEWRADAPGDDHALSDSSFMFTFQDNPTVDVDDPDAVLSVRDAPDGARTTIPRSAWRFTDATHVAVDGGFLPFHWYELVYRPTRCPVVGTGLLAARDLVSHLREGSIDHALGHGVSQSGRFLRQLLGDGLNVDEQGRTVFDGVLSHIAGGRRGEFNHRYAQPSLTHVIGFGNAPPYDTAGLLARQRDIGGTPRTFFVNTAWEYWRGDGALVHADAATGDDLPEEPDSRSYLLSGTDHMGAMPLKDAVPAANPVHHLDASPVLRALFLALAAWACDGVEPPPSRVPRRADGTAASREDVLARFADRPGVHLPDPRVLNVTRAIHLGPQADRGIGRWPLVLGEAAAVVVSDVDERGNEVAGIRLPEVAAGAAAFTGWNPRIPTDGLPDVLYEFVGSRLPAVDRPAREAFEAEARAAARALADDRLLLEVDIEGAVATALAAYDAV